MHQLTVGIEQRRNIKVLVSRLQCNTEVLAGVVLLTNKL